MRIYFILGSFGQGGAQIQCGRLANALAMIEGVEVQILYFLGGPNIRSVNQHLVQLNPVKSRSLYDPVNIIRIASKIQSEKPDIIFSWLHSADVLTGLSRRLFPRQTKWVLAERDSRYPRNWRYQLRDFLGRQADLIIANSSAGKRYWENRGVNTERIFVKNNILEPLIPSTASHPKFDFLYAGRLEVQKNVEVIVRGFCILAKRQPSWKFGVIGDGSLAPAVNTIIHDCGLEDQISSLPYTNDLQSFLSSGPVFVNMSHHEGLPNTVLENIRYGNPVVLSSINPHIDIVGDDYPFLVIDYQSPEAVANTLEQAKLAPATGTYKLAQEKIRQMESAAVANSYFETFSRLF